MKKKLCSILLCAVLLLSSGGLTAKAAAETPPKMTIEVNQVTGGTTVEVSLIVEGATDIQSAHAVLSYDTTKLTLIQWDDTAIVPAEIPAAGGTMAPGNVAGKPSLVLKEGADNWANLYFGAAGQQAHIEAGKQVVTVQFQYGTGGTAEELTKDHTRYLKLAERVPNAFAMMPDVATLHAGETRYTTSSIDAKLDTTFSVVSNPSLYNKAGTATAGDYAITFFDWDGAVIDAISGEGDMSAPVAALTGKSTALTKKTGYDFDTWLTVTSDSQGLHTLHGTLTSSKSGIVEGNQDLADFSNVQSNLLVQAAYKTNSKVNSGVGADGSLTEDTARYEIGAPTFYQYGISPDGTNGQYAVRCTVERGSVLRADKPTVLAMVYVGSGSNMKAVTVKVDLDSTDATSFEVVVPKATANVTFTVLDTHEITAWTMGTSRSKEGSAANREIVKGGSFALLVDEARAVAQGGNWTSYINAQCFQDAGYPKVNTGNLDDAKSKLAAASQSGKLDRTAADAALAVYK